MPNFRSTVADDVLQLVRESVNGERGLDLGMSFDANKGELFIDGPTTDYTPEVFGLGR